MTLSNVLALLVVFVAVPLNWLVAALLWRLHRASPELTVIRERGIAATAVAIAVTTFAVLMVNNDASLALFDSETAKTISRAATLALSLAPGLYWLWLYRREA